jgi:uncharacterized protein (DUF362 family)/Pyruvate/2-oxoacid:ferredoxin oxidoreductase delta subunit
MQKVIVRKASYDYETLRTVIFDIMDGLDNGQISKGRRVLIKPNLLAPATPEGAMLTHPLVIKAVAEYVHDKGGRIQVSDSPAMGSFEKVLKESGIAKALGDIPVDFREFKNSREVKVGEPFKKIEIAEDALDADVLINIPKLKTHSQMLLTLGVKNLFGCIVGLRKPEWHLRAGVEKERFAQLLVQIYKTIRPSITIMDGILAMEGEGPGKSGTPRKLGLIMGSTDALAMDIAVTEMLGLKPETLFTNKAATDMGLAPGDIKTDGEMLVVKNFALPVIGPVIFGPPALHGFMRRHFIQRPDVDNRLCKHCGECWKYCPAKAITPSEKEIAFDYDRCIRCFCCVEVCPHGALRTAETLPGKVLGKLVKHR